MGEPEQVIGELDEMKGEEGAKSPHPPSLQQQNPGLIANAITADGSTLPARHPTMAEIRERMQEQYNKAAAAAAVKEKEREKMKEDKKAEWERMQLVGGQRLESQDKSSASVSASSRSNVKWKAATKPRMRPEYNPLTGDTGASSRCRWKPSSRGPSGGG